MGKAKQHFDDFRDLDVWQRCSEIRQKVFAFSKHLPQEEKYRLVDQMIRASRSACACIAEGYGRFHYQENIQFCRQARGSLYELIDHFLVCSDCQYLRKEETLNNIDNIKFAIKLLNGYVKYLKKRKEGEN